MAPENWPGFSAAAAGRGRRRFGWSTFEPGMTVSLVARGHGDEHGRARSIEEKPAQPKSPTQIDSCAALASAAILDLTEHPRLSVPMVALLPSKKSTLLNGP
jgi:hypothetical protein